jgi:HPt (histidine-containing phosphotransfer) domain-containing protein
LERFANDRELFAKMVRFFLEDCPPLLEEILEHIRTGNAKGLHSAAHSLKGLAASFDAAGTVCASLSLERAGAAGELEHAQSGFEELLDEARPLRAALVRYQQDSGP